MLSRSFIFKSFGLTALAVHRQKPWTVALLLCIVASCNPAFAAKPQSWPKRDFLPPIATVNPRLEDLPENGLDSVDFAPSSKGKTVQKTPRVTRLDNQLPIEEHDTLQSGLMAVRQKVEEADLEHLWQATVQKNPVIRFSLEKLAAPADTQPRHSSRFLRTTLNTLISGATMASTMFPGGGAYGNMMKMSAGNAAQNILMGRSTPTPGALTSTEQIQLATLVDELKTSLIRNYQNYNATLQSLAQSRETTARNSAVYTQAQNSHNDMAIMAASSAYFQALLQETNFKQKARMERISLERIAGQEAVSQLALVPVFSDTAIVAHPPTQTQTETIVASVVGPQQIPAVGPQPVKTTVKASILTVPKKTTTLKTASTVGSSNLLLADPNTPQAMLELSPNIHRLEDSYGPPVPEPMPPSKLRVYRKAGKAQAEKSKTASDSFLLAPLSDKILDTTTVSVNKAKN